MCASCLAKGYRARGSRVVTNVRQKMQRARETVDASGIGNLGVNLFEPSGSVKDTGIDMGDFSMPAFGFGGSSKKGSRSKKEDDLFVW